MQTVVLKLFTRQGARWTDKQTPLGSVVRYCYKCTTRL